MCVCFLDSAKLSVAGRKKWQKRPEGAKRACHYGNAPHAQRRRRNEIRPTLKKSRLSPQVREQLEQSPTLLKNKSHRALM
jgi:hypothetical protein